MDTKELEQICRSAKFQIDRLLTAYIGLSVEELLRLTGRNADETADAETKDRK